MRVAPAPQPDKPPLHSGRRALQPINHSARRRAFSDDGHFPHRIDEDSEMDDSSVPELQRGGSGKYSVGPANTLSPPRFLAGTSASTRTYRVGGPGSPINTTNSASTTPQRRRAAMRHYSSCREASASSSRAIRTPPSRPWASTRAGAATGQQKYEMLGRTGDMDEAELATLGGLTGMQLPVTSASVLLNHVTRGRLKFVPELLSYNKAIRAQGIRKAAGPRAIPPDIHEERPWLSRSMMSFSDAAMKKCCSGTRARRCRRTWRKARPKLRRLVHRPSSSWWAFLFAVWIMVLILLSSTTSILETVPSIRNSVPSVFWWSIEVTCNVFFTVEIIMRFLAEKSVRKYLEQPLNTVDVVAVAPFYLQFAFEAVGVANTRIFRVLRLVRVVRLFKMSRWMSSMQMFLVVISKSISSLGALLFLILLIVLVASTVVYVIENPPDRDADFVDINFKDGSPFTSIPMSMYYSFSTITCVGYGDIYPLAWIAKTLMLGLVLLGSLIITMPLSVLSTHFQQVSREWRAREIKSGAVTTRMLRPLRAAILEKYPRLVVRETDATTMTESDATAHLMHVLVGDSEKDLACRYAEAGLEDDVLKILADLDAFEEHIQQRLDMVIMALVELNDRLAYCGGESQMAPSIFDA